MSQGKKLYDMTKNSIDTLSDCRRSKRAMKSSEKKQAAEKELKAKAKPKAAKKKIDRK